MVRTPTRQVKTAASPRRPNGLINLDLHAMSAGPSVHLSNTPRFKRWHVPLKDQPPVPSPPRVTRTALQTVEVERLRTELAEARQQVRNLSESNKMLYAQNKKLEAQLASRDAGGSIVGMKTVKGLSEGRRGMRSVSPGHPTKSVTVTQMENMEVDAPAEIATTNTAVLSDDSEEDVGNVSAILQAEDGETGQLNFGRPPSSPIIPIVKVTPPEPAQAPPSDHSQRSSKTPVGTRSRPSPTRRRKSIPVTGLLKVQGSPRSSPKKGPSTRKA